MNNKKQFLKLHTKLNNKIDKLIQLSKTEELKADFSINYEVLICELIAKLTWCVDEFAGLEAKSYNKGYNRSYTHKVRKALGFLR